MRAASLPRFQPGLSAARAAALVLFVALALFTVLLVSGTIGVGAAEPRPVSDFAQPFRWLTTPMA